MSEEPETKNLLVYLKEKGISHADALQLIKDKLPTGTAPAEPEEEPVEPTVEVVEEKPQDSEQKTEEVPKEPKIEQISKDDLKKLVEEEVQKQLQIKRKVPSKGKVVEAKDIPKDKDVVKKNWFEVIV